jgi:hypothetical protein
MHIEKFIILFVFTVYISAYSQNDAEKTRKNADEIFASIMQTMPEEMKMRADSAKSVMESQKADNKAGSTLSKEKDAARFGLGNKDAEIDKLPASVKSQVQKTIKEIEQQQTEHMMEFKENKNKR